jgi:hypothetical protein
MALASMIIGVAALTVGLCFLFFPVLPILAIIFGHLGLNRTHHGASGRGFATAGLVLGYVGLALAVAWLILAIIGTLSPPTLAF